MRAALLVLVIAACNGTSTSTTAPATSSMPPWPSTGAAAATGSGSAEPATPATPGKAGPSRVETKKFHTDALGVDKTVLVYLPANYDVDPAKRYPVFYYLHGLGGDETNWVSYGKLPAAADAMKLEAIVVMPDGDNNFYFDSPMAEDYDACMKSGKGMFSSVQSHPDTCVHASKYETYIQHDLIAWTDTTYRTLAKREARAIAGLSMGGFGALQLGMRFPETFAAVASHSGVDALLLKAPLPYPAGHPEKADLVTDVAHWGEELGAMGAWFRKLFGADIAAWRAVDPATLAQSLEPGKLAIYLDCGTEDDYSLHHAANYLHDILTARHIEHAYFLGPGQHNFSFWRPRLPFSLAFLRDHVAKS